MTEKLFRAYKDFRGGLNADTAPESLADNEFVEATNVEFTERGAFSTRRGTVPLSSSGYPNGVVTQLIPWKRNDGSEILLAVINFSGGNQKLCKINISTGEHTVIKDELLTDEIGWFALQDKFYFTANGYWVYDGTTVSTMDLDIPDAPIIDSTVPSSGAVNAGAHRYILVTYNSFGYYNCSDPAYVHLGSASIVVLNIPACTDPDVVRRALFRTMSGGTEYYEINNNIGLGALNNLSDSWDDTELSIGPTLPEYYQKDLADIARCKSFVWHPNSMRIFATRDSSDPSAVYFSEQNDPTNFKTTNVLYPTIAEGDAKGVTVAGDKMIVLYADGAWYWQGVDPAEDAQWFRIPVNAGTVHERTVALTPEGLVMLGRYGVHLYGPNVLEEGILSVDMPYIQDISGDRYSSIFRNMTDYSGRGSPRAIYDNKGGRYILAFKDFHDPGGIQPNNKVLVIDWSLKAASVWTGLRLNDICQLQDGTILAASYDNILKLNQGYKDWDNTTGSYKPIEQVVKTKFFDFGQPFFIKKVRRLLLAMKQDEPPYDVLQIQVVSDKGQTISGVELRESLRNEELYGLESGLVNREARLSLKGTRFQVVFTHSCMDEPLTIYGLGFIFKSKKPKGTRDGTENFK